VFARLGAVKSIANKKRTSRLASLGNYVTEVTKLRGRVFSEVPEGVSVVALSWSGCASSVTAGEKELLTALKRVQFSLICRTIV
jgi:hypothetical protein